MELKAAKTHTVIYTAVYNFDISKDTPVNKHTGELKKLPTLIPIDDDSDLPF